MNQAKYSRFQVEEEEKDSNFVNINNLDNLKKSIQNMFDIQRRNLVTNKIEELSRKVEKNIYFVLSQTLSERRDDTD